MLCGVAQEKQGEFLARVNDHVTVAPFDLKMARITADVLGWRAENLKHHRKQSGSPREIVKIDAMVVATAKSLGATLYSFDDGCQEMARRANVTVGNVPEFHPELLRNAELLKEYGLPD